MKPRNEPIAATPPMGWNPWNAFRTDVDETKFLQVADAMIAQGLVASGYTFLNIDDGWWWKRDENGQLQVRTSMFPSAKLDGDQTSFRPFIGELHARGLKAGIYTDIGRNSCSQMWDAHKRNLPVGSQQEREVGSFGHQVDDARRFFKDWGFDYIKVDACGLADYTPTTPTVIDGTYRALGPYIVRGDSVRSDPHMVATLYEQFAQAIRKAAAPNQPTIAICAWGEADVNDWAPRYAHLWRTSADINSSWKSMLHNFDSAAPRALFAGPGHWNDPDLLEVGNGEFDRNHLVEARAHFSMWAIIAAPLMLSYDLSKSSNELLDIVKNPDVIAIDQDPAGNQGIVLSDTATTEIVYKSLARQGTKAVALINRTGAPASLSFDVAEAHLKPSSATRAWDIWNKRYIGVDGGTITVQLEPHETALLRLEGTALDAKAIYLDEMPSQVSVLENGSKPLSPATLARKWVPARVGFSPSGETISTAGLRDTTGIGTAMGVKLRVHTNGRFRRFRCIAHRANKGGGSGRPSFTIYGDGKLLFTGHGEGDVSVDIPVDGVRNLDLVAPTAEEHSGESFVWGKARLLR